LLVEKVSQALLYEGGDSVLHRLDPRVKLLYAVLTALAVFCTEKPGALTAMLVVQLLVAYASSLLGRVASLVRGLVPFLLTIMALNTVLIYVVSPGIEYLELVRVFYAMVMRVLVVLVVFTVFISTTSPHELMQGLVEMGLSYTAAYPLVVAFRFIPIVFAEVQNVYDAQRARGLEFERGNVLERLRKLVPIIVPSVVCSLLRAKDLAEAMEARGFGAFPRRTFYRQMRIKALDVAFLAMIALVEVLCVTLVIF